MHALRDNPAGRDIVKRVHRKCLWHTEELLRKMIELDAIASQGDEEIKRARRVTVLEIQAIMDQVDAVSRRLQVSCVLVNNVYAEVTDQRATAAARRTAGATDSGQLRRCYTFSCSTGLCRREGTHKRRG